jgi:hypothetical protein
MCYEDRMVTCFIELLYVGWIALALASLNFGFSTAVVFLLYFVGALYEENRSNLYRNMPVSSSMHLVMSEIRWVQSVMY